MYYAYHIDYIPEVLTARYPKHAVYGGLAIFGESIEAITGIALKPEEINSYIHIAQSGNEADEEQARIAADDAIREALQLALMEPDSREIRVSGSQAHTLHSDWLLLQPDQETS
jgi:hypothetical protein